MTRSFPEIESYLSHFAGLNPSATPGVIGRAVERVLAEKQIQDPIEYLQLVKASPQEFDLLLQQILIPETWFFRYPEAFEYLTIWAQDNVRQRLTASPLKILSMPCSTGEEPYSIAISLLDAGLRPEQFTIDAADICGTALQKAREGCYTRNSFRNSNGQWWQRHFQKDSNVFRIRPEIIGLVRFFVWNVLLPPPERVKPQYDVIFCRNLLIYFHPPAQQILIATLDNLLNCKGLLFVGHAEAGPMLRPFFRPVAPMKAFVHTKDEH